MVIHRFRGLDLRGGQWRINGNLHTVLGSVDSPDIWFCQLC